MVTKTDKIELTGPAGNVKATITAGADGEILVNGVAITAEAKKTKKSSPSPTGYTESQAYGLTKEEQVSVLAGLGLGSNAINRLRYEKDRVEAILRLQK